MPHKRAKHSARQSQRDSMGYDLPPRQSKVKNASISDIPRHARALFERPAPPKRSKEAVEAESMRIRPGEKMKEFNERVEQTFAPQINATMRKDMRSESNSKKRERRKEYLREKRRANNPAIARREAEEEAQRDWQKASSARSLHDVAQAPPTLTRRPRPPKKSAGDVAVEAVQRARPKPSPARQRILDAERERVVAQYRQQQRKAAPDAET